MATSKSKQFQLKAIFTFLLILALTIASTTARRILDEEPATPTVAPEASDVDEAPTASGAVVGTGVAAPVGAGAAPGVATPTGVGAGIVAPVATGAATHVDAGAGVAAPSGSGAGTAAPTSAGAAGVTTHVGDAGAAGVTTHVGDAGAAGVAGGAAPVGSASAAATAATAGGAVAGGAGEDDHIFSFFMHDILGGSNPSAIAVTGIATNPSLSGQVPFAKPNGAVLAVDNGVPVNSNNNGIISNNNIPFLTGLSGTASNVVQNNGNNIIGGGSGFPALNMAQLGSGITFQKLMFGTLTVFDDELTESHELNSGLVGKAQGFYVASSEDGNSQTMAFTVMFHSGSYSDSLTFFGVHRTRVSESHLAIMGGTGKYVNAKGFATVKTFPAANQQETDGVQTLLHITVYLAY
ncbi:dirigent protein 25-like [Nicotiana tabacum]|uniref:Dirigent protein n=2 Tax=Nicotiana TaxID=4085 RepID=A0A1S4BXF8_TOBAC|nr:PREDICTED: dirigent protein 25 [Nicotiana sylvestris]XP_016493580.1 PREDICTED: dirigent protein 25-like [Nicotiana tabacum]